MQFDLLDVLVCPICQSQLQLEATGLLCPKDQLIFPIIDGIPVLLVDEAHVKNDDQTNSSL